MEIPQTSLQPGDKLHGFTVKKISEIAEVQSRAIELEHDKSGARVLHLLSNDPENLLAIALRTPPPDDTGLPHILEHTVLCGSEKYPVKDPFVELLKTSLATFLNAMTYPDKTVYPCASMNEKDFFNLAGVYCDAVFKPLITEKHFKQEGHHFDFATPGDINSPLIIKGIVYNEMKGAYSDLDGTIDREETRRLFPDNAYGLDSGGDPQAIPTLSYEDFVDFHRRYYHPANSFIFLYGNIATEKHLEFLDKQYLEKYERIDIDSTIDEQPVWSEPRSARIPYPASENDQEDGKTAVTGCWYTGSVTNAIRSLALKVLENYLLDNSSSPLRKALIDSKLGEELTNSGYADYQRDSFFTVGLKGTAPDKAEEIIELIRQTCCEEAENGLNTERLESAFHQLEIAALEIKPQYPLRLMDRVYRSWLYEGEPTRLLNLPAHLNELRERFKNEPRFFENLLMEAIVDNRHQLTLIFIPDAQVNQHEEQAFIKTMESIKSGMSAEELEHIAQEAAALEKMQQTPNSPEALATLPKLSIDDVSPEPLDFPVEEKEAATRPLLISGVPTSGLFYGSLAFDMSDLSLDELKLLPLYTEALNGMGAAGMNYAQFAEKEASCCSGLSSHCDSIGNIINPDAAKPYVLFNFKGLERNLDKMLQTAEEKLLFCDFTDLDRLKDIILQARINRRAGLIPAGNAFASLYAGASLNIGCYMKELFTGVTQIRLYEKYATEFDGKSLSKQLQALHHKLLNNNRLTTSLGGSSESISKATAWLEKISTSMQDAKIGNSLITLPEKPTTPIGLAAPADVAFVAKTFPAVSATDPAAAPLALLSLNLSFGYLWNEVRARRGAYGCRASHSGAYGMYSFSSYRDPFINETLETYSKVIDYISNEMDLSADAIEQAVIGTVKTLDIPWRPAQAVSASLSRKLSGSSAQIRRKFRSNLLGTTESAIRNAVETILKPNANKANICVLSNQEKLARAKGKGLALHIEDV